MIQACRPTFQTHLGAPSVTTASENPITNRKKSKLWRSGPLEQLEDFEVVISIVRYLVSTLQNPIARREQTRACHDLKNLCLSMGYRAHGCAPLHLKFGTCAERDT